MSGRKLAVVRIMQILVILGACIGAPVRAQELPAVITIRNTEFQRTQDLQLVQTDLCNGYVFDDLLTILPVEGGWDQTRNTIELRFQDNWCRFIPGFNRVLFNNHYVTLSRSPCIVGEKLIVPIDMLPVVFVPLLAGRLVWDDVAKVAIYEKTARKIASEDATIKGNIIVIDPGHGGSDSGIVLNKRIVEKNVVLKLAELIRTFVQESPEYGVKLTRDTDYELPWEQRCAQGNRDEVLWFLSIHGFYNEGSPQIRVYRSLSAKGEKAPSIQRKLLQWGEKRTGGSEDEKRFVLAIDQNIRRAFSSFQVMSYQVPIIELEYVSAPAVLVEIPLNAPEIAEEQPLQRLASALAAALRSRFQ